MNVRLNLEAQTIAASAFSEDRRDNGPPSPRPITKNTPRRACRPPVRSSRPKVGPISADVSPSLRPKELASFNEHGLGLSLVARIVIAHGGRIDFSTGNPAGFETTMRFPLESL